MSSEDNSWRTEEFRKSNITKIENAIKECGAKDTPQNGTQLEKKCYKKAKTKGDYLGHVAQTILQIKSKNESGENTAMKIDKENFWRSKKYRESAVTKIEEAIENFGAVPSHSSAQMEKKCFQKAQNQDEYLNAVAQVILDLWDMGDDCLWNIHKRNPSKW